MSQQNNPLNSKGWQPNVTLHEYWNDENNRSAKVHKIQEDFRVELFEDRVFTRVSYEKSETVAEEIAQDWVDGV